MNSLVLSGLLLSVVSYLDPPNEESKLEEVNAPSKLSIRRGPTPEPIAGPFFGIVSSVQQNGEKVCAYGVNLRATDDGSPWLPKAGTDRYKVVYGPLSRGDIVPVLGGILYRVESTTGSVRSATIRFRRLERDEIPAKLTIQRDSYIVPLSGYSDIHESQLRIQKITQPTDPQQVITARIEIQMSGDLIVERGVKGYPPKSTHTFRVGDSLRIDGFLHNVRNIVPADNERQIFGWVELEAQPLKSKAKASTP